MNELELKEYGSIRVMADLDEDDNPVALLFVTCPYGEDCVLRTNVLMDREEALILVRYLLDAVRPLTDKERAEAEARTGRPKLAPA
jgi:hypothetical protein